MHNFLFKGFWLILPPTLSGLGFARLGYDEVGIARLGDDTGWAKNSYQNILNNFNQDFKSSNRATQKFAQKYT